MKSTVLFKQSHSPFSKGGSKTWHRHAANDNFESLSFETGQPERDWKALALIVFIALCFGLFVFAPLW